MPSYGQGAAVLFQATVDVQEIPNLDRGAAHAAGQLGQ